MVFGSAPVFHLFATDPTRSLQPVWRSLLNREGSSSPREDYCPVDDADEEEGPPSHGLTEALRSSVLCEFKTTLNTNHCIEPGKGEGSRAIWMQKCATRGRKIEERAN